MRYVRSTNTLKLAEDTAISKSYVRTNYLPTANAAQVLGRYGLEIIGDGNNNDTLYLQADTTFVQTLSDTFPYFAPIIGYGNATDTALFSLNDVIWGVKWESSHSFVITKVTAVVYGTSPDIDIALLHDVNFRDATPTAVLSADLTVTSTTTGNETTSFSSATIASGQWLWIRVDQQTAQPTQCIINIYGYLE